MASGDTREQQYLGIAANGNLPIIIDRTNL